MSRKTNNYKKKTMKYSIIFILVLTLFGYGLIIIDDWNRTRIAIPTDQYESPIGPQQVVEVLTPFGCAKTEMTEDEFNNQLISQYKIGVREFPLRCR